MNEKIRGVTHNITIRDEYDWIDEKMLNAVINGFTKEKEVTDKEEKEYLEDLLSRLMTEVRPYCRPSFVNYDVFPVFKEATEYMRKKNNDT